MNTEDQTLQVPPQKLSKYNRESGKKTLAFVGVLILIVVIFTVVALFMMNAD